MFSLCSRFQLTLLKLTSSSSSFDFPLVEALLILSFQSFFTICKIVVLKISSGDYITHVTYIVQALLSISAVCYAWCFSCLRSGICVICTHVLAITVRQWRGRGSGRGRQLGKTFYRRREEWHMVTVTSGSNLKHNPSRKLYIELLLCGLCFAALHT